MTLSQGFFLKDVKVQMKCDIAHHICALQAVRLAGSNSHYWCCNLIILLSFQQTQHTAYWTACYCQVSLSGLWPSPANAASSVALNSCRILLVYVSWHRKHRELKFQSTHEMDDYGPGSLCDPVCTIFLFLTFSMTFLLRTRSGQLPRVTADTLFIRSRRRHRYPVKQQLSAVKCLMIDFDRS